MPRAQEILFGSDSTERIVAVEPDVDSVQVYRRLQDNRLEVQAVPFKRWILAAEKHPFADAEWTEFEGGTYRFLAEFPDLPSYRNARYWLRDSHAPQISMASATRQYLIRSGRTLFKGMAFDDVLRLQLDIETVGLKPEVPDNRILMVSISDNTGFDTVISGDERDILHKTIECIQQRDPDVIEGHNIYGFDLPYLSERANMAGIPLAFGRDGSEVRFGNKQNCAIGYYSRPYVPAHIHGRQIIDTMLAVQRFDVARGELSSYGLKAVAQALGVSEDEREILRRDRMLEELQADPDRVKKYAVQDVRETRSVAELICPAEFYLTQMVPYTYTRAAAAGTGERINALFIRAYLDLGHGIPEKSEPKSPPGGYTDVRATGVIERIVKCDVESLYRSIMLTNRIKPRSDTLDVFLPALQELTNRRFDAKRSAKQTAGAESAYWNGLQSAFKIVINSFYGYLAGPFNFNDYDAAAQITTTGQSIVKDAVAELEKTGSQVLEVDTDGVYFHPPAHVVGEDQENEYIDTIGAALPEGIHLAHDGRYAAMISVKRKNYVLAGYDGHRVFRGSSLRSRSDEPFGLDFISDTADFLISGDKQAAGKLYALIVDKINNGKLGIKQFARRERITQKTFTSPSKKRIAQAVGSAKVGDYVSVYERADGLVALAKDYNEDEDRDYLLDRLYKFACRLKEAFGPEFDTLFPKPSAMSKSEAAGQKTLGLFD